MTNRCGVCGGEFKDDDTLVCIYDTSRNNTEYRHLDAPLMPQTSYAHDYCDEFQRLWEIRHELYALVPELDEFFFHENWGLENNFHSNTLAYVRKACAILKERLRCQNKI